MEKTYALDTDSVLGMEFGRLSERRRKFRTEKLEKFPSKLVSGAYPCKCGGKTNECGTQILQQQLFLVSPTG
jgi:hypothetical protein